MLALAFDWTPSLCKGVPLEQRSHGVMDTRSPNGLTLSTPPTLQPNKPPTSSDSQCTLDPPPWTTLPSPQPSTFASSDCCSNFLPLHTSAWVITRHFLHKTIRVTFPKFRPAYLHGPPALHPYPTLALKRIRPATVHFPASLLISCLLGSPDTLTFLSTRNTPWFFLPQVHPTIQSSSSALMVLSRKPSKTPTGCLSPCYDEHLCSIRGSQNSVRNHRNTCFINTGLQTLPGSNHAISKPSFPVIP